MRPESPCSAQVGGRVGRLGQACRDRWREKCLGDAKRAGAWIEEENQKLTELVEEYIRGKEAVLPPHPPKPHTHPSHPSFPCCTSACAVCFL